MVAVGLVVYFGQNSFQAVLAGEDPEFPIRFDPAAWSLYVGIGAALLIAAALVFGSWYFTHYVIDEEELRIDTGMVFRQSKRIPFTKVQSVDVVQPALARIVGLAELNIDAGPESSTRLRYLTRDQAYRFRDYLLVRAHGQRTTVTSTEVTGGVLEDIGGTDEILVRIGPPALLAAALLSTETLVMAVSLVAAIILFVAFDQPWIGVALIVPFAFGMVAQLNKSMFSQFNYTLARSGPGLKITRGLTSLTSQAVPRSRIQGVRIVQWWLWRPFGLYRVDMELLGLGGIEDDGSESHANSSILVPAGTAAEVETAVAALWPGVPIDDVELVPSPLRARRFRPISGHLLRHGANGHVAVVTAGRFTRYRWIIPIARLQSVGITQGPLQRAWRLADVRLHTAGRVLHTIAKHLDPQEARRYTLALISASRAAGPRPQPGQPPDDGPLGWPRPSGTPATTGRSTGLGFPRPGSR